jgi:hypothetical protein
MTPATLTATRSCKLEDIFQRPVETTDLTAYDFYLRAIATFYPTNKERILDSANLNSAAICGMTGRELLDRGDAG